MRGSRNNDGGIFCFELYVPQMTLRTHYHVLTADSGLVYVGTARFLTVELNIYLGFLCANRNNLSAPKMILL